MSVNEILRALPAVERALQEPVLKQAVEAGEVPRSLAVAAVREVLEELRHLALAGGKVKTSAEAVAVTALERARERAKPTLKRVINATGVVLHTNLGRAPLAPEAVEAMQRAAGYCNLEYDLKRGVRGYRHDAVRELLCELTGAESALVVNNNAAAVLLVLTALCRGREVVVSRGQLVEIGGAFRVPDVMAQSGATLREVGTTNKTRLADYESAVGPDTAALLKVHTSNYRVLGFVEEVPLDALVALGRRQNIRVIEDLGSGLLGEIGPLGGEIEPDVRRSVEAGADVVTFSGDKLLGGPQAGIVVGRREAVAACEAHPLMRALRPDKVTLAALEATLALYRDPERAARSIPTLRMLREPLESLDARARVLAERVKAKLPSELSVAVEDDLSEAGGGSLPLAKLPTRVVAVRSPAGGVARAEARLRACDPPVIARVREDALVLDPRTLADDEFDAVASALAFAFSS
jgi:L-seryl-tRNA(Ser) seleniumtransferase